MKKILIILFTSFVLHIGIINIKALFNNNLNTANENIEEKISITYNLDNTINAINLTYTIPNNYSQSIITISPTIFNNLINYNISSNTIINIKIINNSKYTYSYLNKSFILKAINLDNTNINRTINEALISLFRKNLSFNKFNDSILDIRLKKLGYKSGILDLDKYYIDFYNNKYNLNVNSLEEFNDNIINEIFEGIPLNIIETNNNVAKEELKWFYKQIVSYTFINNINNLQDYSINNYMLNEDLGNTFFVKNFSYIWSEMSANIRRMNINIKKHVASPKIYMEFKLERINMLNDK